MSADGPPTGEGDQPVPAEDGPGQSGTPGSSQRRFAEMDDDQLLAALGEVLRTTEAPPSWSVELAKASYGLLAVDAELAVLTSDSGLATAQSALRSAAAPRLTVFDSPELSVEIQIEPGARAGSWRLIGQLSPAAAARIQVRQPQAEPFWVDADDMGRFTVDEIREGPLSLLCERPGLHPAVTQWIAIG